MNAILIATFTDTERQEIESVKDTVQKKLRELLSDLPTDTYPFFKESILTGGCFASLFLDEEVHDWDVYLRDSVTISRFESFVMSDTPTLNEVADVTSGYMTITNVDGKLVKSCVVNTGSRIQETQSIVLGDDSDLVKKDDVGFITNVKLKAAPIAPQEAWDIYSQGFGGSPWSDLLNKYKVKLSFIVDNQEQASVTT